MMPGANRSASINDPGAVEHCGSMVSDRQTKESMLKYAGLFNAALGI